jgi:hypothetical protein
MVSINQCHAVNIATRGYIANDAGYIATVGRLWFKKLVWREFIYITFTSAAINKQISITSSVNKEIKLTTTVISNYNVF